MLNTTNFQIDLFTTNLVGGYSQLPMANGYTSRCTLHFMTNSVGDYFTYNLTNTVWYA